MFSYVVLKTAYDCGNKIYRVDASCQPTCGRDVIADYTCYEEPEEGCVCPTGLVLRGEECVHPDECGCFIDLYDRGYIWHLLVSLLKMCISIHPITLRQVC